VTKRDNLDTYAEFAKPLYVGKDPAHDFRHIERITARLDRLSAEVTPPPKRHLLFFLACFHGLRSQLRNDSVLRDRVTLFLRGQEWPEEEIQSAFEGLDRHLDNPGTPEERIIHDANYIELLGAFGIAKAFTTGGARGQSLEESADIFEYQYLDRVRFQTPVGRRMAEESRDYTKAFLAQLRSEW
jgi:uncharacterized protein